MLTTLEKVAAHETGVAVEEADDAAVRAVLDRQARRWLGMSGEDFLGALAAGDFDATDDPATARMISTARLIVS